jgi:hypothetical protein
VDMTGDTFERHNNVSESSQLAREEARERLKDAVDAVRCPQCDLLQSDMFWEFGLARSDTWIQLGSIGLKIFIPIAVLSYVALGWYKLFWFSMFINAVIVVGGLGLLVWLSKLNPNQRADRAAYSSVGITRQEFEARRELYLRTAQNPLESAYGGVSWPEAQGL